MAPLSVLTIHIFYCNKFLLCTLMAALAADSSSPDVITSNIFTLPATNHLIIDLGLKISNFVLDISRFSV